MTRDRRGPAGPLFGLVNSSDHPSNQARYAALQKLLPAAMAEYARVHGSYPPDYAPPAAVPGR